MDPDKIVILSMFCGEQGYVDEKKTVEETWSKDAVKAGFRHIFYAEAPKGVQPGLYGNVLYVKCRPGRLQTYDKTVLALKYVDENFEYDAVVKTNVSTYVNVKVLTQALEYMTEKDKDSVYCNRLLYWKKKLMWPRGDFTIFSRDICREITENYEETKSIFRLGGQDDSIMFYLMYGKHGLGFCKRLKTIPSACCKKYEYANSKNACAIRLKMSEKDSFGDICKRMRAFHKAVKAEKRKFGFEPKFNETKVKDKDTPNPSKITYSVAVASVMKRKHAAQRAPYGRIAVYTCITGGYDTLQPVKKRGLIFDFICFTDKATPEMRKTGWTIKPIPADLSNLSAVKKQRIVKICPHRYLPEYEVSLWLDANVEINDDIWKALSKYDLQKFTLYTSSHPARDCIYQEERACVRLGKDSAEHIRPQIEEFRKNGFPAHAGLAETCIILRRHKDQACEAVMETWAGLLLKGSHRDQLSFDYACWKNGFKYGRLTENYRKPHGVFELKKHHKAQIVKKTQNKAKTNVYRDSYLSFFPA